MKPVESPSKPPWAGGMAKDKKESDMEKRKKRKVLNVLFIALFAGMGLFATIYFWENPPTYTYKGKETFRSVEDYAQFKEVVGSPNVEIHEWLVLSSDLPIVVVFNVSVLNTTHFPYGETRPLPPEIKFIITVASTIAGGAFGFLTVTITAEIWRKSRWGG